MIKKYLIFLTLILLFKNVRREQSSRRILINIKLKLTKESSHFYKLISSKGFQKIFLKLKIDELLFRPPEQDGNYHYYRPKKHLNPSGFRQCRWSLGSRGDFLVVVREFRLSLAARATLAVCPLSWHT